MLAGECTATARPAPRADPRPLSPLRRGGQPAAAGSCGVLPQAPPQSRERRDPARRGRNAAVRVSGAAAPPAPKCRGLTEGHVSPPSAAGAGRRGWRPPRECGREWGGRERGLQRPRAPAGEVARKVTRFPASGSVGTARSREQAREKTSGDAAAQGSSYLCLGAESGPGSLGRAGPASRVTPPNARLRERAAELVPERRRRRSGRAPGSGGERKAAGSAVRRAGAAQTRRMLLLQAASREASLGLSQHFPAVSDTPLRTKRTIQPGSRTHQKKKIKKKEKKGGGGAQLKKK